MSLMSQRPSYRWGLEYEVAVSHEKHSRPILWTSFFMPILPFSSHETSCNECIANISLPMIFRWHIFVLCLWTVRESLWIKVFRDSPNLYRAYRVIQNNDKMGKNYKTLTWYFPQNRVIGVHLGYIPLPKNSLEIRQKYFRVFCSKPACYFILIINSCKSQYMCAWVCGCVCGGVFGDVIATLFLT